ncbi:uncharacterized protein N7479_007544 [Penicillium vulpinum]|uniref:Uncharacterized protein n=1 Tax=Penicillium vulpinum TaxID=29845 RepID=A0A1V6SB23_9EURO|nr:uncharacterized protein N7479_007544 [Penicillium vulpinum]KAJ5960394.1 hypothetical protein N7479_007544 [Penicillium vulpinum]OQE11078.1 hypothetical protein PENVUL_c003G03782 [Penicillium vulpinum]
MIRRPPTIIALEEKDVESHLQRIYIRHTLTVEFEQLHLDDESCDEMDPSPSSHVSSEFDEDIDTTGLTQEGSSCFEPTSPRDRSCASTDAIPHTSITKSCLKSPIPNQHSSLQVTISTGIHLQADRSDPPRLKVKFALSPQEHELHSGNAPLGEETDRDRHRENYPPSDTDAIYTPMLMDSPTSTPQVSFLSCGVSSSPASASVPLLAVASTMSYEAVLAEGAVSPDSVANSTSENCDSHVKTVI